MLKNKYVSLLVVIVVVVALIAGVQMCDSMEESTTIKKEIPKNYEGLKKEIISKMEGEEATWNKSTYGSLEEMIEDYEKNKLLSANQVNELKELLVSSHLVLLTKAVQKFCEESNDNQRFQELQADVVKFQKTHAAASTEAKKWIDHYAKVTNLIASADAYARHQAHNEAVTENYQVDLKEYQTMSFIEKNKNIQDQISDKLKMLGKHAVIGRQFTALKNEVEVKAKVNVPDCEKFKVNTYYYAECDKLKNPEKYEKK